MLISASLVSYAEDIDYDSTLLFSGGINPAHLLRAKINGNCTPIYPHQRLRVNTIFEVVKSKGKETAYTDKHPSYDLVRGIILMPFCFGSRARAQPMPKVASRAFPLCSEGTFKLVSESHDILQTITVMKLADEIFFGSQRWPEDQGISESPRFLIHPGTSQSLGLCRSIPWHDCQETPRCAPL